VADVGVGRRGAVVERGGAEGALTVVAEEEEGLEATGDGRWEVLL